MPREARICNESRGLSRTMLSPPGIATFLIAAMIATCPRDCLLDNPGALASGARSSGALPAYRFRMAANSCGRLNIGQCPLARSTMSSGCKWAIILAWTGSPNSRSSVSRTYKACGRCPRCLMESVYNLFDSGTNRFITCMAAGSSKSLHSPLRNADCGGRVPRSESMIPEKHPIRPRQR